MPSLLMIPGPVETHESVLHALAQPCVSHVSPVFIAEFGEALKLMRRVFLAETGQPVVLAGSGTLGWDVAACNLLERGDSALVLSTGYFGDRFGDCLTAYGAEVTYVRAPLGGVPSLTEIEAHLSSSSNKFRVVTITHVDTSTGVLVDIKAVAALVHRLSPNTLVVVDGVCSVAGEELRMDEWGIDFAMTASQKAVGVPPGLCLMVLSSRAVNTIKARKTPVANYYADLNRWLPIMKVYEEGTGAYFATPAVNLVRALNQSLKLILAGGDMDARFALHRKASQRFKNAVARMGLQQVPISPSCAANTMTAIYFPENVGAPLLSKMAEKMVTIAGGLHPDIKTKYFRIGHMNISAVEPERRHLETTLEALEKSLLELGAIGVVPGSAIAGFSESP